MADAPAASHVSKKERVKKSSGKKTEKKEKKAAAPYEQSFAFSPAVSSGLVVPTSPGE